MGFERFEKYVISGLLFGLGMHLLLSHPQPKEQKQVKNLPLQLKGSEAKLFSIEKSKLDRINKNMGEIDVAKRLRSKAVEVQNLSVIESAEKSHFETKNLDYGVTIKGEDSSVRVYRDMHLSDTRLRDMSPGDKITKIVALEKWDQEYEEGYKEAFVREFIRKAKKSGYLVKVNQNLEVVSVRKIKRPHSYVSPK